MENEKSAALLSRRERQIMDIVYAAGQISAADVLAQISDPPSYSTIRKLLGILVEKGHLITRQQGARYLYRPKVPRGKAGRSALMRVLETFYEGSLENAVAALIGGRDSQLSPEELQRLRIMIEQAESNEE